MSTIITDIQKFNDGKIECQDLIESLQNIALQNTYDFETLQILLENTGLQFEEYGEGKYKILAPNQLETTIIYDSASKKIDTSVGF